LAKCFCKEIWSEIRLRTHLYRDPLWRTTEELPRKKSCLERSRAGMLPIAL
jgi:hypothetical protein